MSENWAIAIFGSLILMTISGVTAWVTMSQRVTKLEVRWETWFDLLGKKSAKVLHSPHTPELDVLLEKYYDKFYELSVDEWKKMLSLCEGIENDTKNPKDQRSLAAIVSAVCHHKLMHPPINRYKYQDY